MSTPLRALLIDDSEEDSELLLHHLSHNGYAVSWLRVDSADTLRAALAQQDWDIALCDYVMPLLSGPEALRILRTEAPDLPAIAISGRVGEEYAVDVMRSGARDYVLKNRLGRLVPAIERELADAEVRERRRRAEAELRIEDADRAVEFVIGALPAANGDPTLVRQLLDNLLSDALKFTRPVSTPRIEVGSERRNGEDVFYVRDNGVGFDPQHAERLFGVFQRLHPAEQACLGTMRQFGQFGPTASVWRCAGVPVCLRPAAGLIVAARPVQIGASSPRPRDQR